MPEQDMPLAVRMRPRSLDEFLGQEHLLAEGRILRRAILARRIASIIVWGPAGVGKTSLGFIIAGAFEADFAYLNAAFSSVAAVKKEIEKARNKLKAQGRRTIIFIDEIHRFNKLQQESLVPDTEAGTILLIGATIYNPYYYLIPSLISRSIVAPFKPLSSDNLISLLKRALKDEERGFGALRVKVSDDALAFIASAAAGDGRSALTALEVGVLSTQAKDGEITIDSTVARESIQKKTFYDRKDNYHYDTISAFIKSMRGSDPDSALYWLAKMLTSGEDPRFIARRMVILASEDIGNADPFALVIATSCFKAVEFVGLPEAQLILAQTAIYLAAAEKSNSAYCALEEAMKDISQQETREVPQHLKTHSPEYKYPHSFGGHLAQEYGAPRQYYFPKPIGQEKKLKDFLESLKHKQ